MSRIRTSFGTAFWNHVDGRYDRTNAASDWLWVFMEGGSKSAFLHISGALLRFSPVQEGSTVLTSLRAQFVVNFGNMP